MTIDEIREAFPGYHLEISLYPSGGVIEATGCEECGTNDNSFQSAIWRIHRGQTEAYAVNKLKQKLGIN